ncbi:hypothetical protein [Nesterenkonia alba]|uniref:hypothetical protein n=1 Tax=Nesterenkonia alba TaxID=515814 RepID=UPI000418D712|nr:hypothetical protein [Nesterenkonia alba]
MSTPESTTARSMGLFTAALAGVLALSSCGMLPVGDDASEDAETAQTAEAAETAEDTEETNDDAGGTSEDDDTDNDATEDESTPGDAPGGEPVDTTRDPDEASQTLTYPFAEGEGEMTVGAYPLQVDGDFMLLTLVFVPDYDDSEEVLTFNAMHGHSDGAGSGLKWFAPILADRENLKAYHVLNYGRGRADRWISSMVNQTLEDGEPYFLFAYYAAPQDDVEAMDVTMEALNIPVLESVEIDYGNGGTSEDNTGSEAEDEDTEDTDDDAEEGED